MERRIVATQSEGEAIETAKKRTELDQAMTRGMADPAHHPTTREGRTNAMIDLMLAGFGEPREQRHRRLGANVVRVAKGLLKSGRADRIGEAIRCEERVKIACARLETQTRERVLQAWKQLSKRIEEAMRAGDGDLQKVAGAIVVLVRNEHRTTANARGVARAASEAMMRSGLIAKAPGEAGALIGALQEWWDVVHPQHQPRGRVSLREAAKDLLFMRRMRRNAMSPIWRRIAEAGMEAAFAVAHAYEHHDAGMEIARIDPELAEPLRMIADHGEYPDTTPRPNARAQDEAPVLAMVGTYPFNPEKEAFNANRKRPTGQGGTLEVMNANEATRAWIGHNACVIPVLCDQDGQLKQSPSGIALAEAVRTGWDAEWAELEAAEGHAERKAGMERRLHRVKGRIVIAGWDADRGVVVACKPAGSTLSRLGELAAGRSNTVFDIARDARGAPIHTDPERIFDAETGWGLAPPTPGDPIFVVPANLTSPERDEAAYSAPVIEGPYASDGIHAQCIALAVAGRLGGTRDIAVMTKGVGQAGLLKPTWKAGKKHPAAINIPIHRTLLSLMAQGLRNGIRIVSHRGQPSGPHHDLFQPSTEIAVHHFGRELQSTRGDCSLGWPKGGPIAGLATMCATLAERNAAPEGRPKPEHRAAPNAARDPGLPREEHAEAGEAVTRIALLMTATTASDRERIDATVHTIRHTTQLEGCTHHHDLLIAAAGVGADETARCVRRACEACYATQGQRQSATARIHPGLPIEPGQCDLVIVGPIDPKAPEAEWMMEGIARAFETGVPVVRADTESFDLAADGTVSVHATPRDRHHALGWSRDAMHQTKGVRSAVQALMAHARSWKARSAVAIGLEKGTLPIVHIPRATEPFARYPANRRHESKRFETVEALYGRAARALRSAIETPPEYTAIVLRPATRDDASALHADRNDIMLPTGKATERGTTRIEPRDGALIGALTQFENRQQSRGLHLPEEGYEI